MASLYKLGRLRSYILVFLILLAFALSFPLQKLVNKSIDAKMTQIENTIFRTTGLTIKYKSFSPSIIAGINIKDISLFDESEEKILEISKARIGFSFLNLIKGDISKGISNVLIDGITLDVDKLEYLIKKFDFSNSQKGNFDFASVRQMLPDNIRLKNLYFVYDNYGQNSEIFELDVKNVTINNNSLKKLLEIQWDSFFTVSLSSQKKTFSGNIGFNGNITPELDNSQLNLKLSNLTDGNYVLNKISLYTSYKDSAFEIHTVQSASPLSLSANFNLETYDLSANVKSLDFSPYSVFSPSGKKRPGKLKNFLINTETSLLSNLKEKNLNFTSDTKFYVPDEIFPSGFNAAFKLSGNEKKLNLKNFSINGERIQAAANLEYIYEKTQLSGTAELSKFILENHKEISTEIYFDPLNFGFMAFSPQLFIGDKALTALQFSLLPQNNSFDFTFEASDYSHFENSDPGMFKIDGSYLSDSKYIQTNISLNSLYFDSICDFIAQFLEEKNGNSLTSFSPKLAAFVLSGDLYASTDFKSLSYNVPYILAANTKKDNQVLMLSLNGSNENFELDQLSLIYGKYAAQARGTFDKAQDSSDMFFTINLNSASIPYNFSGSIMPQIISISGDYGTDVEIRMEKDKSLEGHAVFKSLPVNIANNSIIFSTDANFHYDEQNGPVIKINNFESEISSSSLGASPKLVFSGNVTKYGAQIDSIAYTDLYSALVGTADLMVNVNEGLFDSVGIMVNVKNPLSDESITIDGNVSNPYHLSLSGENLLKYMYLNLQLQLHSFSLNRFTYSQNEDNKITATLYTSGTIEHPYVSLNIENTSMLIAQDFLKLNGSLILEDRDLQINDFFISYNDLNVKSINAKASLTDMTAELQGQLEWKLMGKSLEAPLKLSVTNSLVPQGGFLPDSTMIELSSPKISGNLIKKPFPLSLTLLYSDRNFTLFSSDNAGIVGNFSLDGSTELTVNNKDFLCAKMDGQIKNSTLDLKLYDVNINLMKVLKYVDFDQLLLVDSAIIGGGIDIGGTLDEPDFAGCLFIPKPDFKLPFISQQKLTCNIMNLNFSHNEIELEKNIYTAKSGSQIDMFYTIFLNKWGVSHVEGSVKTVNKELFPIKLQTPVGNLDGDVFADLNLYFEDNILELTGNLFGENVNVSSSISSFGSVNNSEQSQSDFYIKTDLNITLGTHSSINFAPVLRCVFVPDTKFKLNADLEENNYSIDGQLNLKSGDLSYLNRSFYIKSGSIKFNAQDITNPLVTLMAETREKDSKNQTVKIQLSVENQYLKELNPRFTSIPAKSETEIRQLLGQIVLADSDNATNFIAAASGYAIQSTVGRSFENSLRDLLNFDIFSLRTNILQNTINLSVSGNLSGNNITIGNLLDNSTVYIGKYINSAIYVDAMLHLSVEDFGMNNAVSLGSLKFQPEFGMEMESPFANIRVNMAPDINALINGQFVPSASLTLSWKFTY